MSPASSRSSTANPPHTKISWRRCGINAKLTCPPRVIWSTGRFGYLWWGNRCGGPTWFNSGTFGIVPYDSFDTALIRTGYNLGLFHTAHLPAAFWMKALSSIVLLIIVLRVISLRGRRRASLFPACRERKAGKSVEWSWAKVFTATSSNLIICSVMLITSWNPPRTTWPPMKPSLPVQR